MEYVSTFYNEEQGLGHVIRFAFISCVDQYAKIEEMPTGHGAADVLFVPKLRSPLPVMIIKLKMIIELKWNRSAGTGIEQFFSRNYSAALKGYGGEIVTIGVNFDPDTKTHTCQIRGVS